MADADVQTRNLPIYPQALRSLSVVCTAAVAGVDTDAPTGAVLLGATGTGGSDLLRVAALPRATCSAGVLYLWASKDGGATKRLIDAVAFSGQTVTATAAPSPIALPIDADAMRRRGPGEELYVGVSVALAGGFVVDAELRDY